jgi:hypothetical protein
MFHDFRHLITNIVGVFTGAEAYRIDRVYNNCEIKTLLKGFHMYKEMMIMGLPAAMEAGEYEKSQKVM